MDITVYLPDEIGKRAKEAELPLSRLLRRAVEDELERKDDMKATLSEPKVYEVEMNGGGYTGRITGALIAAADNHSGDELYLTDDERLLYYDGNRGRVAEVDDDEVAETLREMLRDDEEYAAALAKLGLRPVVDL
jgi:hypothetical protein